MIYSTGRSLNARRYTPTSLTRASRIYAKSVTHDLEDMDEIVSLFALVSRIRLMATEPVIHAAEAFVKLIVTHYREPNLSVQQLLSAALSAKAEPLEVFSLACRNELRMILQRGELSTTLRS